MIISKKLYFGGIATAGAIGILLHLILSLLNKNQATAIFTIIGLSVILIIVALILNLKVWYKAWSAIQDGHARTTPKKAIGFLLIPFFNLYWAFQAYVGFVTDYHSYIERHNIHAPRLPKGIFITSVILQILGIVFSRIPVVSIIHAIINYVILLIMFNALIDGVNRLDTPENFNQASLTAEYSHQENEGNPAIHIHIGIVVILLCSQPLVYLLHKVIPTGKWLMLLGSTYHWAVVIYLATLCRHKILRWIALALPIIMYCYSVWTILKIPAEIP